MIAPADFFLMTAGLIAGVIDAIAGGGGLINLPSLILVLGPGIAAIGTNKIVGFTAALVSFSVYLKNGLPRARGGWTYILWIALGSFTGSRLAAHLPARAFLWLLLITCPAVLVLIWRRDFLMKLNAPEPPAARESIGMKSAFILSGLACGLYDGIWGPGGGTFMLLALLLWVRLPLLTSILISKLANTASAGVALASYAQLHQVHWFLGAKMAAAAGLGSYLGAEYASKQAARIFRPVLTAVVILLLIRVGWSFYGR